MFFPALTKISNIIESISLNNFFKVVEEEPVSQEKYPETNVYFRYVNRDEDPVLAKFRIQGSVLRTIGDI